MNIHSLIIPEGLGSNTRINMANYDVLIHKIGYSNLTPELQNGHQFFMKYKNEIESNAIYRETIQDYIDDLNVFVSKLPNKKQKEIFQPENKGYSGRKFVGKNYAQAKNLPIKDIAKLVKEELQINYPKEKFSVSTDVYSGGQSLTVRIKDVYFNPYSDEYKEHLIKNDSWEDYRDPNSRRFPEKYNEEAKKLLDKVRDIVEQYNYDDSDAMTDYFSVNFYSHVGFDDVPIIKKFYPKNIENNNAIEWDKQYETKRLERNKKDSERKGKYKKGSIVYYQPVRPIFESPIQSYKAIIRRSPNGRSAWSTYDIWVLFPYEALPDKLKSNVPKYHHEGKEYYSLTYTGVHEDKLSDKPKIKSEPKKEEKQRGVIIKKSDKKPSIKKSKIPRGIKISTPTDEKGIKQYAATIEYKDKFKYIPFGQYHSIEEILERAIKILDQFKKENPVTEVRKIDDAGRTIRRYVSMNGKEKTRSEVKALLAFLQRAIISGTIRKTDKHAHLINRIQDSLIIALNKMGQKAIIEIDIQTLQEYKNAINSEKKMQSVELIKQFISISGKPDVKDQAKKLYARMLKAIMSNKGIKSTDKYKTLLDEALVSLQTYIDNSSSYVEISKIQLSGLQALGMIVNNYRAKGSRQMADGKFTKRSNKKKDWSGHGSYHGGLKGAEKEFIAVPGHNYKGFEIDHYKEKHGKWGFIILSLPQKPYDSGALYESHSKSISIAELKIDEAINGLGNPLLIALATGYATRRGAQIADAEKEGKKPRFSKEPEKPKTEEKTKEEKKPLSGLTLNAIKEQQFEPLGLGPIYSTLIGQASKPTSIFIYGSGGSGKSTLALRITEDLNKAGNSIAYIAGEQYMSPTFTELITRLELQANDMLQVFPSLKNINPDEWDIIVLDSKDSLGITVDKFRELKKNYPNLTIIITSQGKKDGNFRGSEEWKNEVDTMINCTGGIAKTDKEKNRWGGKGEMKIS